MNDGVVEGCCEGVLVLELVDVSELEMDCCEFGFDFFGRVVVFFEEGLTEGCD